MATDKSYLEFIKEQCRGCDELVFKPMMGEYLVYYKGKLIGDVCDNRLLLKPVNAVKTALPDAEMQLPYDGAKTLMVLVDNLDDGEFLSKLFEAAYAELPEPKPKKKSK